MQVFCQQMLKQQQKQVLCIIKNLRALTNTFTLYTRLNVNNWSTVH